METVTDGNQFRKTKIVCTIGPTSNTREKLWRLADEGMNVARMNMSHGDHASHKAVIDLIKEYNKLNKNSIAIMLDTKGPEVRSGDLTEPIDMVRGELPSLISFLPNVSMCTSSTSSRGTTS